MLPLRKGFVDGVDPFRDKLRRVVGNLRLLHHWNVQIQRTVRYTTFFFTGKLIYSERPPEAKN